MNEEFFHHKNILKKRKRGIDSSLVDLPYEGNIEKISRIHPGN